MIIFDHLLKVQFKSNKRSQNGSKVEGFSPLVCDVITERSQRI